MAGSLQAMFDWSVQICNMANPYALYTMNTDSSEGPTRYGDHDAAGNVYYDCSSFVAAACTAAGYTDVNPWFTTWSMGQYLQNWGFQWRNPSTTEWQPGDILVINTAQHQHTEIVYEGRRTMGAHTSEVAYPDQVSISSYNSGYAWEDLYRDPNGMAPVPGVEALTPDNHPWSNFTGLTWHRMETGYGYETSSAEARDNAKIVMSFCMAPDVGWSREATCALLGNLQAECGMNPGEHEVGGEGLGLVQWTPESVLYTGLSVVYGGTADGWASRDWYDGTKQLNVLFAEYMQTNYEQGNAFSKNTGIGRQWYNSSGSAYGFSLPLIDWYDWARQTGYGNLETMVKQFMVSYLRPAYSADVNHWEQRVAFAQEWYGILRDFQPITPGPGPAKKKGMPLWMMCAPRKRILIR